MKTLLTALCLVLLTFPTLAVAPLAGDTCTAGENGAAAFMGYPTRILACNGSNWVTYVSVTTQWTTSGSNIYYNTGNVSIGSPLSNGKLFVDGPVNFGVETSVNGDLIIASKLTATTGTGGLATLAVSNSGTAGSSVFQIKNTAASGTDWSLTLGGNNISGSGGTGLQEGNLVFHNNTNNVDIMVFKKVTNNVAIGGALPVNTALLDINATTKGFKFPSMTQAQRLAIPSPAEGLLAYQKDAGANGKGWYGYDGAAWQKLN